MTRGTAWEITPGIATTKDIDDLPGRIPAAADANAAGLIAGEDGRRYGYGLTDLRSSAPQAGDAVDFRIDASPNPSIDPGDDIGAACDLYPIPGAVPVPTASPPARPGPDWTTFYVSPSGLVALGDYWLYGVLVLFAVNIFIGWIPILGQIASLVAGGAGIALAIKRCHDVDRSGWWSWLPLAPLIAATAAIPLSVAEAYPAAIAVGGVCGTACLAAAAWVFFAIPIRKGDSEANRFGAPPTRMKP